MPDGKVIEFDPSERGKLPCGGSSGVDVEFGPERTVKVPCGGGWPLR